MRYIQRPKSVQESLEKNLVNPTVVRKKTMLKIAKTQLPMNDIFRFAEVFSMSLYRNSHIIDKGGRNTQKRKNHTNQRNAQKCTWKKEDSICIWTYFERNRFPSIKMNNSKGTTFTIKNTTLLSGLS
jgi:hypothetical protein